MHGVQSVTDLMVRPGIINLDFADVETVMASMGKAMMGTGEAEGEGRAMKAAEMAISNPLIDDYTLKGAKGLLVNITGGEDLKLFEVDEVVNKIRAEVDVEAEVIIGAITDATLDGKIRVSIVATSLDGQHPEAKSVINMVHRIQNRNPGYSDFAQTNPTSGFNFLGSASSTMVDGANALQINNEETPEETRENNKAQVEENVAIETQEVVLENVPKEETNSLLLENEINNEEENTSNGLENFEIEEETPDLFNSEDNLGSENETTSVFDKEETTEEDDLEIPAFLRRQKN